MNNIETIIRRNTPTIQVFETVYEAVTGQKLDKNLTSGKPVEITNERMKRYKKLVSNAQNKGIALWETSDKPYEIIHNKVVLK
jgi:hypothetical protein